MKIDWHQALDVYFIAGSQDVADGGLSTVLQDAINGGITCFQFREKGPGALTNPQEIYELGLVCREICQRHQIPFVVNDDLVLALKLKADGIHVGQSDQRLAEVVQQGQRVGMAVGFSVNNLAQFQVAKNISGIAYLGVGPVFPTQSKVDAQPVLGLARLEEIVAENNSKPLVAIGGINLSNSQAVRGTGVDGLALISALTQSQNLTTDIEKLKGRGK